MPHLTDRAPRRRACALTFFVILSALVSLFSSGGFVGAGAARRDQVVLSGRVTYSTGEPAAGVTVVMDSESIAGAGGGASGATATDGGGNYFFTVEAGCGIAYNFRAFSDEVVDGESLKPSTPAGYSGCVITDRGGLDMVMQRPKPISFDGYVRDGAGAGRRGVTVKMVREKYDLTPPITETFTATTDAGGHYSFNTWARCSVAYEFSAAVAGGTVSPPSVGFSGCILQNYTVVDFNARGGTPADPDDAENAGRAPCNSQVGEPVNVTNGNVFLDQTDYRLPGVGSALAVTRTYNSTSRRAGLFGRGWSTAFDESIDAASPSQLRLNLPDGRAVYFDGGAGVFTPRESSNLQGRIARDAAGNFTLSLKGGSTHRFNPAGKLLSTTDRYSNRTSLAYDAGGGLSSITDPFGRTLAAASDGEGRVVALSDSLGAVASYAYGPGGELLSVTYPDGSGFHFDYATAATSAPLLTTVTDALGNTIESHAYDANGRAVSSERDGGVARVTLDYVSANETRAIDARGHVTNFFFDKSRGRNLVTRVEGGCSCGNSQVQAWTYDNAGRATSVTDALGRRTVYAYDANGNLSGAEDALGRSSFTYNAFGQVLTTTDALGNVTTNTYDADGKLLSTTDALGNTNVFAYDARSQLIAHTDARGHTLSLAYDASGNLTRATDAAGNAATFAHDARGRLTSRRDALGNSTAYEYDAANRPSKVTRADGSVLAYAYDRAGRLTKATDARGNSTAYAYDGAARLTSVTDAAGGATTLAYDQLSNLTGVVDQSGRATDYAYDEFGRMTKVTYPAETPGALRLSESLEYDAVGNVLRRTDVAGRESGFEYDAANRVVAVTDPLRQTIRYEYDALSRVTAVTDALGQRYSFGYDALGRPVRAARPGAAMSLAYDANGNLTRRTDYGGAETRYTYDALDRLTRITYPDASFASYEYDQLSRLIVGTNAQGSVRFAYDSLGRTLSTTDVFGQTLAYAYDANGNRTSLSVGGAPQVTYAYDALDRLIGLTDAAGASAAYAYDAAGRRASRTLPNGLTTRYEYDDLNRLTRLADSPGPAPVERRYAYDAAGNITQLSEDTGAHAYAYDALDRLTAAAHPLQAAESYAYDAVGNRAASHRSATYVYQPFNRLSVTAAAAYAYDANGNLTSKSDAAGARQFMWDAENRLREVRLPDGSRAEYAYDALGRRVKTAAADRRGRRVTTTSHTYDGAEVLRETASEGRKTVTTEYLRGAGTDELLRQTSRPGHGRAEIYYPVTDHQGSTRQLLDERGRIAGSLQYDAFGDGAGSPLTRYAYTGRERDDLTGLYYYRARWYDPQTGRFLSEDPIGLAGGINTYSYVSNNPVNRVDPSGLYEIDVHYYLTYFLAIKSGCFNENQARLIADADQGTDENPDTLPGLGVTDKQRQQNRDYHALHPGSYEGRSSPELWSEAMRGNTNYVGLGRYLHNLQDTFSHAGFQSDVIGHVRVLHYYDKTASDVPRAMRMAGATWIALNNYAKARGCGCQGKWDRSWWQQVYDFARESGANFDALATIDARGEFDNFLQHTDPMYLERKMRILGLSPR